MNLISRLLQSICWSFLLLSATRVFAQAQPPLHETKPRPPRVSIIAPELSVEDLPPPGEAFIAKVRLANTRDTTLRIRALSSRDGYLTEIPLTRSYLNEYDSPTYEFQFYSPVAELAYQFILYRDDGSTALSNRIRVRRPCIPNIDISKVALDPTIQGEERLNRLALQMKGLERDLQSYDTVFKLLEDLDRLLRQ